MLFLLYDLENNLVRKWEQEPGSFPPKLSIPVMPSVQLLHQKEPTYKVRTFQVWSHVFDTVVYREILV